MLANNVQETTTTTGTGNITLLGSDEFGNTFASKFSVANSERFKYEIDDEAGNRESGIGYLLDSTTLVRETVLDSSNGGSLVNFGVGTKKVFVSGGVLPRQKLNSVSNKRITSSLVTDGDNTITLSANRINYIPFKLDWDVEVNAIGCFVQNAAPAAGTLLIGLYESGQLFEPNKLIFEASLNPQSTGAQQGAVTQTKLKAGWYWLGQWCDTTPGIKGGATSACVNSNIYVSNTGVKATSYRGSLTGLTNLPNPAADISAIDNNWFNHYLVEV